MNKYNDLIKSNNIKDTLNSRKEAFRKMWKGIPLSHVPVCVRVNVPSPYTMREATLDADKQLEVAMRNVEADLLLGDCTDFIPAMRPDVGCSCIANAFGAEYYWGESHAQTPGIKNYPLISDQNDFDLDEIAKDLEKPDIQSSQWLTEGFKRIRKFAEAGEGVIPVALLDAAGGLNVAADLLGMPVLLESMYLYPDALHKILKIAQDVYLEVIAEGIKAAGGEDNISTTDFVELWFPEGMKGHVSDDISACISPEMYNLFSGPYHDMIFDVYGPGGLHNCGPNPCAVEYVGQRRIPGCIDLGSRFSFQDLPALRDACKGKAFIYLAWEGEPDPVDWFRSVVEICSPDLLVVPLFNFGNIDDAKEVYPKLKTIAEEYAKQLNWYAVGR